MHTSSEGDLDRHLRALIRDVPDFPKPGILFKDITPVLADSATFGRVTEALALRLARHRPAAIAAIESRGFIFGAAIARRLDLPLQLVRKPGKLPRRHIAVEYALEYGTNTLEMHLDATNLGDRVALVDDLLATGGTAEAAAGLVKKLGGIVCCSAFLVELSFLGGRRRLPEIPLESIVVY